MQPHPVAAAVAATVARRDPQRLAAALTETVRLRALLPGGLIESHGRANVAAAFRALVRRLRHRRGARVGGRGRRGPVLIHYRLGVSQASDALGLHADRGLQGRRRAPGRDRPVVFRLPRGIRR